MGSKRPGRKRPRQAIDFRTLAAVDPFQNPPSFKRTILIPDGPVWPGGHVPLYGPGKTLKKLWLAWTSMHRRCGDVVHVNYPSYGGRGISVCPRWADFCAFITDMGYPPTTGHSIDRIDNDGNYEPGNCRWATKGEQALNTRRSPKVEYLGRRMTVGEFADRIGADRKSVSAMITFGMSPAMAYSVTKYGAVSF